MTGKNYYKKILTDSDFNKVTSAQSALESSDNSALAVTTAYIVAPVLFDDVNWVICKAVQQGVKRLFFLARDGFILYKIALLIKDKRNIDIDCRFLYISRYASRIPLYGLLGNACWDIICEKKKRTTLRTVLRNITLVPEEQDFLISLLGNDLTFSPDEPLDIEKLSKLKDDFRRNQKIMDFINQRSEETRKLILLYLEQEGVLDTIDSAFVDVGWRGTIQSSLNKLTGKTFLGFYFGLYETDVFGLDICNACSYLFSSINESSFVRHSFNNSLFEVFCAAPYGMTTGYKEADGEIIPVFEHEYNKNASNWNLNGQIQTILAYTEAYLEANPMSSPDKKMTERLLRKIMEKPSFEEANLYGDFLFSDETDEELLVRLAPPFDARTIVYRSFVPNKLWHKLFAMFRIPVKDTDTFWMQGSLARSKTLKILRAWYRFYNYYHTFRKYLKKEN